MKNSLATSILVLTTGCSHGEAYIHSHIEYESDDPSTIKIVKFDKTGNLLLSGENKKRKEWFIQSINSEGRINWEYSPQGDVSKETTSVKIADFLQASDSSYIICTNNYPTKNTTLSSTLHVLSESGDILSRSDIKLKSNKYNGNVLIEKCWEHDGNIFILGSIYGGLNFKTEGNPGTIYWIQKLTKDKQVERESMIPSGISQRASVTDLIADTGKVTYIANNGKISELVNLNLINNHVIKSTLQGRVSMVAGDKIIKTIEYNNGLLTVSKFDAELNKLSSAIKEFDESNYIVATYSPAPGSIAIVSTTLTSGSNKLQLFEADDSLSNFHLEFSQSWFPPAIFSAAYSRNLAGEYALQYSQYNESKNKFKNSIFKIKRK